MTDWITAMTKLAEEAKAKRIALADERLVTLIVRHTPKPTIPDGNALRIRNGERVSSNIIRVRR